MLPMNHNDDAEQNASAAVSWLGVSDAASALGLNAMWIPTAREVRLPSFYIKSTFYLIYTRIIMRKGKNLYLFGGFVSSKNASSLSPILHKITEILTLN